MTVDVTGSDYRYEGSVTIYKELAEEAGFLEYEEVFIHNPNGHRDRTYVLYGNLKGQVQINGALSSNHKIGDKVHILAFISLNVHAAKNFKPKIL